MGQGIALGKGIALCEPAPLLSKCPTGGPNGRKGIALREPAPLLAKGPAGSPKRPKGLHRESQWAPPNVPRWSQAGASATAAMLVTVVADMAQTVAIMAAKATIAVTRARGGMGKKAKRYMSTPSQKLV